jgi:hypothetical protein
MLSTLLKATYRNTGRATRGKGHAVPSGNRVGEPPTLKEFGISKKEAMNARRLVALPEKSIKPRRSFAS